MEPIIGMRHREAFETCSMAKATSSKEQSKLQLVPLTHELLLHLANISLSVPDFDQASETYISYCFHLNQKHEIR